MAQAVAPVPPDPTQARLETLLLEATNPANTTINVNVIKRFCDTVGESASGPGVAARLLGHRIQSPQEHEALQALAVLEAAARSCGPAFHQEVAKFRFLNEMIKLVSPKYLGGQRPEHVKRRVVELLYCWTRQIPGERKIAEAYAMLKAQGVVGEDPEHVATAVFAASLPPRQPELDPEQQERLQKLLHSKNVEDLQTANMMIKSIVSKDEERMERLTKRLEQLQTVRSNVRLLEDMMDSYSAGSTREERELMGELCSSCEALRPGLYRLASELVEDEASIGEILAASDDLTRAIDRHRALLASVPRVEEGSSNVELLSSSPNTSAPSDLPSTSLLDLDPLSREEGVAGPLEDLLVRKDILSQPPSTITIPDSLDLMSGKVEGTLTDKMEGKVEGKLEDKVVSPRKGLEELDLLGESLLRENLSGPSLTSFEARRVERRPLNSLLKEEDNPLNSVGREVGTRDLTQQLCQLEVEPKNQPTKDLAEITNKHDVKSSQDETKCDKDLQMTKECEASPKSKVKATTECDVAPKWSEIHIEMSKIEPRPSLPPLQLQDSPDGLSAALHFTSNRVAGWPGAAVVVATLTSRAPGPLSAISFRPVLPRGCRVRLMPPSATALPPYSPFTPPPAVTQVLVLAGPEGGGGLPTTLGFVLTYLVEEEQVTDIGKDISLPEQAWAEV